MSDSWVPVSFFLSQSSGKEYAGLCVWPHGESYLLEILDRLYQEESIESLRIIRVRHWSWTASLAWIYLFDNSKMSHLAAKTKYLRRQHKYFYFILLSANALDAAQLFSELKNRLRIEFNSTLIPGAGEHDHLFHMTDNTFDGQRLYMRFEDREIFSNFFKRDNFLAQRVSPDFLVKTQPREIDLRDCEANLLSLSKSILRPTTKVALENTPHVKFANGDEVAYRNYLMTHLGNGLRYPYSPLRFRRLLEAAEITQPVTLRSTKSGRYLVLDGLHRSSIALARGREKIYARVV